MTLLDAQITALAAEGLSPYEIEERLGIPHYTIHVAHHAALMAGYAQEKPSETVEKNERGKKRGYTRAYYTKNREQILEKHRKWRATPEGKAKRKQYYEAHKEAFLQKFREYRKKNREKLNAYQLARYHKKKAERDRLKAESEEYRSQALGLLKQKETNND